MASLSSLIGGGGVRKVHYFSTTVTSGGSGVTPSQQDHDVSSLAIVDYTKCVITQPGTGYQASGHDAYLTSNINLRTQSQYGSNTYVGSQIVEYY